MGRAMPDEQRPPAFQPPSPPPRRLKDVDLPTFSCLLFVLVALGVAAGLALFYLLLHLFGLSVG
jgi:hypothetical protein